MRSEKLIIEILCKYWIYIHIYYVLELLGTNNKEFIIQEFGYCR